jgi:hypothetical protein
MKELHGLIDTPRAVNRFTNTYRLLRATLQAGELDGFERPDAREYRAVLLLLALLVGRPYLSRSILRALGKRDRAESWQAFAAALVPEERVDARLDETRRYVRNTLDHRIGAADAERWHILSEVLKAIRHTGDLTIGDFQPWVRRVARYAVHPLRFERPVELELARSEAVAAEETFRAEAEAPGDAPEASGSGEA